MELRVHRGFDLDQRIAQFGEHVSPVITIAQPGNHLLAFLLRFVAFAQLRFELL
jgi:hypothetical protein